MPDYLVTDPQSGRKLKLTGDSPPTEAELEQLFAQPETTAASPGQRLSFADSIGIGAVTDFSRGMVKGLQNFETGVKQLGNTLDFRASPEEKEARDAELQAELTARDTSLSENRDNRLDKTGIVSKAGSLVGEALPSTLLPGGPGGSLVRRVAGGVASDVASSVADPVREGETREGNLLAAATFSSALRVPGSSIGAVFKRFSNAKAGKFSNADYREIVDQADAEQIRIFFDDVTQGTFAQKASVAAEYFGRLGTGRGRELQNVDARKAAERWVSKLAGDSDDFAEVVQKGLSRKLDIFKQGVAKKYARVANEIGDAGEVGTKTFNSAVDSGVAAETAKGTRANKQVMDFLQRFKDAPRGDFESMIEFRSDFSKELSDFLTGDVSVNKSSMDVLMKAKEALDADMAEFASSHGAEGSWRAANKFYADTVAKFKEGKLKALVNGKSSANFDEQAAWRYLVQNTTNPQRARKMFQSLDAKGRSAVRAGLLKEAFEKAAPEGAPFSPARFSGYLESKDAVIKQFFRGRTGEEIDGLTNVMRHIERAGQFAENPPTGQRVIPLLLAGGTLVDPSSAVAAGSGALGLQFLFQSKTGRNLLFAASTATEGSKKMDAIMEDITKVLSRTSN